MTSTNRTRTIVARLALIVGAVAVLATGADHLEQYTVNQFSTVPTIGPLFLLNFIAATLVGVGLLLPFGLLVPRFADVIRAGLALAGLHLQQRARLCGMEVEFGGGRQESPPLLAEQLSQQSPGFVSGR